MTRRAAGRRSARSSAARRPPGSGAEFDSRRRSGRRRRPGVPPSLTRSARQAAREARTGRGSPTEWLPHARSRTSTGTEVVHLQQYFRGLRVYRTSVVAKTRGRRTRVSEGGVAIPPRTRIEPRVTASRALDTAVRFLQRRGIAPRSLRPRVTQESRFGLQGTPTVLACKVGFSEPLRAHLEVFPTARRRARLAWVLDMVPRGRLRCEVVVSADTARPAVLFFHRTTSCLDFPASWIRFPGDAGVGETFPIPRLASPLGRQRAPAGEWLDAIGVASGPSVSCHIGSRDDPTALSRSDVENAFVWCNVLHDLFESFGFDSSLGAFDSGEDALQVRVFESRSSRAGFFDNKVDGSSPAMVLFATRTLAGVHAALDPSVLVHEYMHGVSNRLLGGTELESPFAGREAQGLNEGYSDYFALTVVSFLDRSNGGGRGDLRRIGTAFKPPRGVRDYKSFGGLFSLGFKDEYDFARVWCAGLLDARTALTNASGIGMAADDADRFLWQALLDSLRGMAPTCPQHGCLTLAHAKDALLTACRQIERAQLAPAGATNSVGAALSGRGIP